MKRYIINYEYITDSFGRCFGMDSNLDGFQFPVHHRFTSYASIVVVYNVFGISWTRFATGEKAVRMLFKANLKTTIKASKRLHQKLRNN